MKALSLLALILAMAPVSSVNPPETVKFPALYRSGETLLLKADIKEVEDHADGTHLSFGCIEMALAVKATGTVGQVEVSSSVTRITGGTRDSRTTDADVRKKAEERYAASSRKPSRDEIEEEVLREKQNLQWVLGDTFDTDSQKPKADPAELRQIRNDMQAGVFAAVLTESGNVVGFENKGKVPEELANMPDIEMQRAVAEAFVGRYRTFLEHTVAYLPRQAVHVGQTWEVLRPRVFPASVFDIGSIAGSLVLSEKATCRLESVRDTPEGRLAVIKFTGRRVGVPLCSAAVKPPGGFGSLDSRGEIEVNLTKACLVSLRIVSTFGTGRPGSPDRGSAGSFIDVLSLTPAAK
jgi:hypothetical protein